MQMSLNVKTPENACIFHFRGGFKLKRVIERGGWGMYFTMVCRIAHDVGGGGQEKKFYFRTSSGGGGGLPKYERENFINNHRPPYA